MLTLKDIEWLFSGHHFGREIIVLCVRWYLRYQFTFRNLVEMMDEHGVSLSHTTIIRWLKRFTLEFVKRWNRLSISAGRSWRVAVPLGCLLILQIANLGVERLQDIDKMPPTFDGCKCPSCQK